MLGIDIEDISNVIECFKWLAFVDVLKSELQYLNYDVICKMIVQYLPSKFDGNVMFKLPPTKNSNGLVGLM
jgi:hypothetical protein